jgi:hypothetical protein
VSDTWTFSVTAISHSGISTIFTMNLTHSTSVIQPISSQACSAQHAIWHICLKYRLWKPKSHRHRISRNVMDKSIYLFKKCLSLETFLNSGHHTSIFWPSSLSLINLATTKVNKDTIVFLFLTLCCSFDQRTKPSLFCCFAFNKDATPLAIP